MSKDPVTPHKHFRFGYPCDELLEALKTFPSVKAIVLHRIGKKGEHPHYHVWITGAPATCNTIKSRLIKHSAHIAGAAKTNGFWMSKAHDSYEAWGKYVMGNVSAEVLLDNPEAPLPPRAELPIVAVGGAGTGVPAPTTTIVIKKPSARLPQRVQFVKYLENKGWEFDSVKEWNMYERLDELIEQLTEFSENAFTTPNGSATVQHALYYFADTVARNIIKEKNKDAIKKSIRLFSM